MSVTAAALRELHRIHQQLAELRDRLERGPKQVRVREANVAQLDARLAEARDKTKQTQMAVDRKQLDLKAGEQKVVDLRVRWRKGPSLEPNWDVGEGYVVDIQGRPCVRTKVEIYPPADHPGVLTVGDTGRASAVGPTADGRTKPDVVLDVSAARFTNAAIVLYVVTFTLGSVIYPAYRVSARIWIETARLWPISGMFELKEQALAIGLGMLPFYWLVWKDPKDEETRMARVATTTILCVVVWYSFIAGHIVNNVRGLFGQ